MTFLIRTAVLATMGDTVAEMDTEETEGYQRSVTDAEEDEDELSGPVEIEEEKAGLLTRVSAVGATPGQEATIDGFYSNTCNKLLPLCEPYNHLSFKGILDLYGACKAIKPS